MRVSNLHGCVVETSDGETPFTSVVRDGVKVETLACYVGPHAARLQHARGVYRAELDEAQVRSERGDITLAQFEEAMQAYERRVKACDVEYASCLADGGAL